MGDPRQIAEGEVETVDGWPRWLLENVQLEALAGLVPKSAECYDMLRKVGQGTYSNVYKARDRDTGKIVALKKVRFETSESESVKFMAREILILRRLDHPNVVKLEGLATSRMHRSIYLVFDFMKSDLARVISRPDGRLTEPQVKCYMQQLLSGLQHCHERGILHRDIKGSNLLIDKSGVLKIADFGLANEYNPQLKRPLTSRVVTLWYRAPELLLGATDYGVGIDLWSAGCLLAEMFAGRPILPGRTELEQLHRIFKLCGSPSEDYWRKLRIVTSFRPPHSKPSFAEIFRDFPASSLGLLSTLLALDPAYRGSASSALQNEFFSMSPLACELSGLPVIYTEDINEVDQSRERRKRKSSRKRRPGAQREGQKKDNQASEKPKGDSGSSKEEKSSDAMTNSGDLNRSSTGSTSSGAKPIIKFPTFQQSTKIENLLEYVKNTKNSPSSPSAKFRSLSDVEDDEITHRSTLEKRSASTVDFRYLVGERIFEHYAFGK
ncbi:putative serine/threonine-protein kinase [Acorus calamus]|uniref:[RNA-polymerase]-subunit kinase n=1 Tax=Acorus calamus TaxID=4465 RepID=A0AAV9ETU4_ACOCL|nr:putative serine/threonine-protein kinase [Acorus calamus]